jgi:hypothetical protein
MENSDPDDDIRRLVAISCDENEKDGLGAGYLGPLTREPDTSSSSDSDTHENVQPMQVPMETVNDLLPIGSVNSLAVNSLAVNSLAEQESSQVLTQSCIPSPVAPPTKVSNQVPTDSSTDSAPESKRPFFRSQKPNYKSSYRRTDTPMRSDREAQQASCYLNDIRRYGSYGLEYNKTLNASSPLNELRDECLSLKDKYNERLTTMGYKKGTLILLSGIETSTTRISKTWKTDALPDLKGLTRDFAKEIDNYDDIFAELYSLYGRQMHMHPLVALGLVLNDAIQNQASTNRNIKAQVEQERIKWERDMAFKQLSQQSQQGQVLNHSVDATPSSDFLQRLEATRLGQAVTNQAIANQAIANQAIANQAIANQAIANQAIAGQPVGTSPITNQAIANQAISSPVSTSRPMDTQPLSPMSDVNVSSPMKNIYSPIDNQKAAESPRGSTMNLRSPDGRVIRARII